MKKWELISKFGIQNSKLGIEDIVKILLANRNINTKRETEEFLNPKLSQVTPKNVKINKLHLEKAVKRIKKAIKNKEQIIVFGDYDVDGICGSAILWETLNYLGAKVLPYIPNRIDEGYGLSKKGISNLKLKIPDIELIITVDNGIVANEAVEFAKKEGIEIIITDHHVPSKNLPKAYAIVHTTLLCGTGVAYLFAKEISNSKFQIPNKSIISNQKSLIDSHLELVALATVADLVPLTGASRVLLKDGLLKLHETKRPGLLALFQEAGIDKNSIGVYEIGHIIAPRLNAMGRLESAMDSLRLVCTTNKQRARELAFKLSSTNKERQILTEETVNHARSLAKEKGIEELLFISNETYEQGVIGLVAGRLVEEFYRPSIVVSKGEIFSKASARSVSGFNIIDFIREDLGLLVDVGGHPMAAGFTVETQKLLLLEESLKKRAKKLLTPEILERTLRIDMELPEGLITQKLYDSLKKLEPFGMKNPEPTFLTKGLVIENIRLVGNGNKHLKIDFKTQISNSKFQSIYFKGGENNSLSIGENVDVVYVIDENEWNGRKSLQLKIKDIRPTEN